MHADQSQHRSPKGLVAREDYNPIISRAASLFKYERGLQMGKIIQFPGKWEEDLYSEYYLVEPELQRFYLRETVALNLTGGYQTGFYELSKKIPKNVLNKLLGSCAAYWADKEQFLFRICLNWRKREKNTWLVQDNEKSYRFDRASIRELDCFKACGYYEEWGSNLAVQVRMWNRKGCEEWRVKERDKQRLRVRKAE